MKNKEELNEYIDYLKDVEESIDLSKITVLTGNNGSGKSLIRKLLTSRVEEELDGKLKSTSMELRTMNNPMWGALSSSMSDCEWLATSYSTFNLLKKCLAASKKDEKTKYIVIDEMEIGCSEETILAFIEYVNQELKELNIGCLIITHSKLVVEKINSDSFINLQKKTKEEWLNREITPTNLEELEANELFYAIRDRINENKKKKD